MGVINKEQSSELTETNWKAAGWAIRAGAAPRFVPGLSDHREHKKQNERGQGGPRTRQESGSPHRWDPGFPFGGSQRGLGCRVSISPCPGTKRTQKKNPKISYRNPIGFSSQQPRAARNKSQNCNGIKQPVPFLITLFVLFNTHILFFSVFGYWF